MSDRTRFRTPGTLWFGAPLVLAACVAAEAAPRTCDVAERQPAQVRLSRLVRDGVARLAQSTRPALGPSQVAFVLFALDRLAGIPCFFPFRHVEQPEPACGFSGSVRAYRLDPGCSSSPTAAP